MMLALANLAISQYMCGIRVNDVNPSIVRAGGVGIDEQVQVYDTILHHAASKEGSKVFPWFIQLGIDFGRLFTAPS
jgi:hypothetical protein